MKKFCKRLIEVDLPIKRISEHARREKSIRYGHISTLHVWWARRPLAACRAIICASIWPDPADDLCPNSFREKARMLMKTWALENLELVSKNSWNHFVSIQKNPKLIQDNNILRKALLDFIADFADWDNSVVPEYLKTSRNLTHEAHISLGGAPDTRPFIVDPFTGGGSIPLEALRLGADAFASDLNPVAVLLNKVVLEYIPMYGKKLADKVRLWGQWIKEEAEKELDEYYPRGPKNEKPIAYLWARTLLSEAPEETNIPVEIPLLRSLWLSKKSSGSIALRWIRDKDGRIKTESLNVTYAGGQTHNVRRPLFEIFEPKRNSDVENGTVERGSVTCPVNGFTTPVARVREQLKKRRGGAQDARLLAVRQEDPRTGLRGWRLPTDKDILAVIKASSELEHRKKTHPGNLSLVPDENAPPKGALSCRNAIYGLFNWGDFFTPRQALALTTFVKLVQKVGKKLEQENDEGLALAIKTCLAQALNRLADFNSSLCLLNSIGGRGVVHTFGRQALPMVWDFMETNPFNEVGANWIGGIEAFYATIQKEANIKNPGQAELASAMDLPLPDDCAQEFITDPPYYDSINYANISDFFYVWLRRTLINAHNGLFSEGMTNKKDECVVNPLRDKDFSNYELMMRQALSEGRRVLVPSGIGIVVFAHKSTRGWEALLQAMISAGWLITGSWPIDTERPGRINAMGTASLASSIHLVCRPRENPDGSIRVDDIGDWRNVLDDLPICIHKWMPRLAEEGVVGADAIFACIGPALEIYSRYSSVEKASGEEVTLKEYLEEVWAAIAREALNMIFKGADASGFEEDARLTAMWLWTLRTASDDEKETDKGYEEKTKSLHGYSLEYDAARKIAQGLGAHLENLSHLVEIKGDTATLLTAGARTRYLFGKDAAYVPKGRKKKLDKQMKLNFEEEIKELEKESGEWAIDLSAKAGSTVLDQLHQCMILFGAGRSEALRRFLVDDAIGHNPLFWRLAQALSALYPPETDEKRWVDGILARKKGLGF